MAEQFVDYRDPNKVAFGDRKESDLFKTALKSSAGRILSNAMLRASEGATIGFFRSFVRGIYGAVAGFSYGLVEGMANESGLNIDSINRYGATKVIIRETMQ